ncbi:MAG: tyrosine--tRNA ligase [Planctomycetota bacterium]|jgi:tyrosyl-tRNA synthetase
MSFLDTLARRGLFHQATADDELRDHLATPGRVAYAGFDPTADSLHIGHYIPLQLLRRWQRAGHTPVAVIGGGTGLIGDPSGKDRERKLLTREQVEANVEGQRRIFERVLDFDPALPNAARLVNNVDWLDRLGYIEVLRDVGKHFSVNVMIQKDSVRERLHNREQGISYTELSYMILQAYDFLHLRRTMDCTVQMAGSDQYGNILAGIDLIRREFGPDAAHAYGITAPLVTTSDGRKMGKTESGAVWLTADRTSPYAFYQYWINLDDADVADALRRFTERDDEEIEALVRRQAERPEERAGQRALAHDLTALFHGPTEVARAEAASGALFSGDVAGLDEAMLAEVFADVPHSTHPRAGLADGGTPLVELLPQTTLASSKREAREFLQSGAVAVNGQRVERDDALGRVVTSADLLHGRTILLRRGKRKWHATRWE